MYIKSKEQKERILELAKLVRESSKIYSDSLTNPSSAESNLNKISELESLGDEIQVKLDEDFQSQKNTPYLAIDRAKLVRRLDDTLDQLVHSARTVVKYQTGLPKDFPQKIANLSKNASSIGKCVEEAITKIYINFQEALTIGKQIEDIRDNSVQIAFEIEVEYFNMDDNQIGWKSFYSVNEIIKKTLKFIIKAKEVSEILEIMAYKYV